MSSQSRIEKSLTLMISHRANILMSYRSTINTLYENGRKRETEETSEKYVNSVNYLGDLPTCYPTRLPLGFHSFLSLTPPPMSPP